jgi:3-hydroxy-3-methylglutaryl CoA synthase/NAD(P)-dependent dehydrogenase (short-subunit alcohol dehydrogenase family)/putative sterol carrier protein
MIGITSYGGYLPRLRMDRMSMYQSMGWIAPATIMVAQGERAFCNWDEDPITMAVAAVKDCLIGMDKAKVDGLYACSTTMPFADRSNAALVQTALNLRADIDTRDLGSTLRAGTGGLISALDTVKAGEGGQMMVVASEMRQAKTGYFYEMWFGDGAAALAVGDEGVIAEYLGSHSVSYDFVDHYRGTGKDFDYMWEERWVRDQGYSKIIPEAVQGLLAKLSITMDDVDKFVFPCFFKAEHRKIAKKLGAEGDKVPGNLHEVCGETGAAHPLVMLVHALEEAKPGDRILVCGFGQGCDALYFRVTDAILDLAARTGIHGCLERGVTVRNHQKFLKFRDLLKTEMGIRSEAPTQTAMTALWRNRKMILGLVGGKCPHCGTAQWPRMPICVNPDCRKVTEMPDYEFADRMARVRTFTGDLLAVSVDPPAVYGLIQFEGGGRFMADFSDCSHDEVFVDQPVTMALRKRYTDEVRGFTGYFWKAIPVPGSKPAAAETASDDIRFDGKVAVVTGAGGGLGRVYALQLAQRGCKVVVNDLGGAADGSGSSSSAADQVVAEIVEAGGEAVANYDSVATVEGGQAMIDQAVEAFGRVDIVINNAGILRDRSMVKMETPEWEAVRSVHLHAAYNVTRPAFLLMKAQGYGRIVMTTSAAGLYGNFGQTNYSAAKMGQVGFAHTLKLEGAKYDVKINTVAPLALTRLTEEIIPAELHSKVQPEWVAPMVLYLCSEGCEPSGQVFNVGGGVVNRAALVQARGMELRDGMPTVEDVAANWDTIDSLEGAEEFHNAMAALGPIMGAVTGGSGGGGGPEPGGGGKPEPAPEPVGLTPAVVFEQMPNSFVADAAAGVSVVFQFKLGGDGGGEWICSIADQSCTVTEGVHENPTTTILMEASDFVEMIEGKANAMALFTGGKLKVEGDLMKSQLIEKLFKF